MLSRDVSKPERMGVVQAGVHGIRPLLCPEKTVSSRLSGSPGPPKSGIRATDSKIIHTVIF